MKSKNTGLPRCARNDDPLASGDGRWGASRRDELRSSRKGQADRQDPRTHILANSAFTIVELLVVIIVIAILAAITIVGYRSVSSNARKSAMASDLEQANKSLQVNKETSSSETFPSTLSGAGITLSNNATYSYNVSADGSNYCLQGTVDGVTKSIAGNNQTVSNSTCVSATNLITNGDFSQGTSGWASTSISGFFVADKTAHFTAIQIYGHIEQSVYRNAGHVYYAAAEINAATTKQLQLNDGQNWHAVINTQFNSFQHISLNIAQSVASSGGVMIQDNNSSNWTEAQTRYILCIDLTTAFGSGNEPTATQMDTILANFPNSWFNGQNVIQVPTS